MGWSMHEQPKRKVYIGFVGSGLEEGKAYLIITVCTSFNGTSHNLSSNVLQITFTSLNMEHCTY
jgi:hypothetical protein